MAPLRSSRSNRHLQQDVGPQGRIRGGVVDHDPMEGLPVRRWEMQDVTIKQDAKDEDNDEDGKQGTNPNWPWPDLPLPKDFHLYPAHSQELLRRARAPNKNPNIAVFNKETGEHERPNLNPNNPAAMTPVSKVPNFKENFHFPTTSTSDPTNVSGKDTDHDAANDQEDDLEPDKHVPEESNERTINLKRWVPLPQAIADRKPEPKYLADRRPGLPPLYGHRAATNTHTANTTGYAPNISSTLLPNFNPNVNTGDVVVGTVTVSADRVANASGYRIKADGTTVPLGPGIAGRSAIGMSGAAGPGQGEVKRRPPPPPPKRRKKGGPGRSKRKVEVAEPVIQTQKRQDDSTALLGIGAQVGGSAGGTQAAVGAQSTGPAESQAQSQAQASARLGNAVTAKTGVDTEMGEAEPGAEAEAEVEIEGEESGSSSSSMSGEDEGEGEGSEEGEIDEASGPPPITAATASTTANNPTDTTPPTVNTINTSIDAAPPTEPALPAFPPHPPTTTTTTTTNPAPNLQSLTSATAPVHDHQTTPAGAAAASTTATIPVPLPLPLPESLPIQPPSPDLLGNLESEIQGMEEGVAGHGGDAR